VLTVLLIVIVRLLRGCLHLLLLVLLQLRLGKSKELIFLLRASVQLGGDLRVLLRGATAISTTKW